MTINLTLPDATDLKPHITVFGVGGAGGNAVNNMIECNLEGVEFVVANTDAQALRQSGAERRIQMGTALTEGLGAGSHPEIGGAAAEEALPEIIDHLSGAHMVFITAGMGGGTGTGAAPVIARAAREQGILTVGVVTKPFHFEGQNRMITAERGIAQLAGHVDTLIVIPNQNLFRIANEKTTFADAFNMADQVLYSGVAGITDLMVKEGLINLDFADVRSIMSEMGKAMMGTGEASGEKRALEAAEAAIANPLLDDVSMRGARGLLISITGGNDLTLYEVDEAASRIREEVDKDANIILGATFDETLDGTIRVSVVATGISQEAEMELPPEQPVDRLKGINQRRTAYVVNERPAFEPKKPAATAAAVAQQEAAPVQQQKPVDDMSASFQGAADMAAEAREEAAREPAIPPRPEMRTESRPQTVAEPRSEARVDTRTMDYGDDDVEFTIEPLQDDGDDMNVTEAAEAAPAVPQPRPTERPAAAASPRPAVARPATGSRTEPGQAPRPHPARQAAPLAQSPRMPGVEDFPPIAQREIESRNGNAPEIGLQAQKKRAGFLERLANVGLGRKEQIVGAPSRSREPSMSQQFGAEGPERGSETPPRVRESAGPLNSVPTPATDPGFDEDQLEIPAFLRRQAN